MVLYLLGLTAHAASKQGVPAFKITAPNGETSLLLGSMHIPYAGLRQPSTSILQGAKHLVIEHTNTNELPLPTPNLANTLEPEVFSNLINTGKLSRANWAKALTNSQVGYLKNNVKCSLSITTDAEASDYLDILLGLKSPRQISDIAMYPCSKFQQKSRDDIFLQAAIDYGVPIVGLETLAAIENQRNAIPDSIYEKILYETLTERTSQNLSKVVDAFNQGDFLQVKTISLDGYQLPSDRALFEKIMVTDRNHLWMPELCRYLDIGQAVVVVGAAHLPDSEGIISLLKKVGYAVEPVNLPTDHTQQ